DDQRGLTGAAEEEDDQVDHQTRRDQRAAEDPCAERDCADLGGGAFLPAGGVLLGGRIGPAPALSPCGRGRWCGRFGRRPSLSRFTGIRRLATGPGARLLSIAPTGHDWGRPTSTN